MRHDHVVESYGRHPGKIRKICEAKSFQHGIEIRVWDMFVLKLDNARRAENVGMEEGIQSEPETRMSAARPAKIPR